MSSARILGRHWRWHRVDGRLPAKKRQRLPAKFYLATGRTLTVVLCNRLQCWPGPVNGQLSCVDNVPSPPSTGCWRLCWEPFWTGNVHLPRLLSTSDVWSCFCADNMSQIHLSCATWRVVDCPDESRDTVLPHRLPCPFGREELCNLQPYIVH